MLLSFGNGTLFLLFAYDLSWLPENISRLIFLYNMHYFTLIFLLLQFTLVSFVMVTAWHPVIFLQWVSFRLLFFLFTRWTILVSTHPTSLLKFSGHLFFLFISLLLSFVFHSMFLYSTCLYYYNLEFSLQRPKVCQVVS